MRNRFSIFSACVLLLIVVLIPTEARAETGEVTIIDWFDQNWAFPVNDLHLEYKIAEHAEIIQDNWVTVEPEADEVEVIIHGDKKGFEINIKWNEPIEGGTTVKVSINITLKGWVCTNQVELVDSYWTINDEEVTKTPIPPHKWKIDRRVVAPGGAYDIYPFRLNNYNSTDTLYIRDLEFGLLHYDLENTIPDWTGWDPSLYIGGDFSIGPIDSFDFLLTTDRWVYPPHVYGHWEFWSGTAPGGSLLVEIWLMHYDHEPSTATQMGAFEVLHNSDGSRTINWNTESEVRVAGFNVLRANNVDSEKLIVNDALIPARGSDVNGAEYSVVDRCIGRTLDCFYWIEDITVDGENSMHGPFLASGGGDSPEVFALYQNYPNPFNPNTIIKYNLARDCHVKLDVYNIAGQRIVTLKDQFEKAGPGSASWDGKDFNGSDVVSGVYFYKLTVGSESEFKKMILMR